MFLYIIVILLSCVIGMYAIEIKQYYCNKKAITFRTYFSQLKSTPFKYLSVMFIYLCFSILFIIMALKKELPMVKIPQYVLFWDSMFICAWIDYKSKIIPNKILGIVFFIRCISIFIEILMYPNNIIATISNSLIGLFIGGLIVLLCRLISRGGVGAGDVKLFAIVGFYFGIISMINMLFYSIFIAFIYSIILLIIKKVRLKSTIALGPFIFLGLNIYYVLM